MKARQINAAAFFSRTAPTFQRMEPDNAGLARIKANSPLKPAKPQEPCDIGLFSDEKDQLDLVSNIEMFMD